MSLLKFICAMLLLGLLLINCTDDLLHPDCRESHLSPEGSSEAITVLTFGQLDRPVDCSPKRIADSVHYVIQDKQSFEELIHCNTHTYPLVDFDKYTLLIGSYLAPHTGYTVVEQKVTRTCVKKHLLFQVSIREEASGYTAITPVTYYAVIPKVRRGVAVEVKVEVVKAG